MVSLVTPTLHACLCYRLIRLGVPRSHGLPPYSDWWNARSEPLAPYPTQLHFLYGQEGTARVSLHSRIKRKPAQNKYLMCYFSP